MRGNGILIQIDIDFQIAVWYNLIVIIKLKGNNMSQRIYKTKQRDEILQFLAEHRDTCFSAKDITERVTAGEATVFRTLAVLVRENKIRKFTGAGRGEGAYYQYSESESCSMHIHLKCEDCGRLIHMDCSFMDEMIRHFCSDHNFFVDCGKTVIYGRCDDCNKIYEETLHEN